MLFEHLTEKDREKISNYIKTYIGSYSSEKMGDLKHILRFWDSAKYNLWEMFGQEFIKEIPIKFSEGLEEVGQKIQEKIYENSELTYFENQIVNLFSEENYQVREAISDLFSRSVLANNKYQNYWGCGNNVTEVLMSNGETLKLKDGTKPMKIISKIVKAYDLNPELFEKYRIAHSMCLNTKELKGTLCLSIHPLDFMTMSDNAYGWSSCMSWSKGGEYRQGTVEMMNSPCVVCAYLKGEEDYSFGKDTWNSKKWRCLFLVDPEFVISVKSYPYYNNNLTQATLKELTKLMGWKEDNEIFSIEEDDNIRVQFKGYNFELCPDTDGAMYNDFGATTHWLSINPELNNDYCCLGYNYCGVSECMLCGESMYVEEGDEGFLTCIKCSDTQVCCNCGRRVCDGDTHYIYDDLYCWSCFEDIAYSDEITGETIHEEDTTTIYLSVKENKKSYIGSNNHYNRRFYTQDNGWENHEKEWNKYFTSKPHLDTYKCKYFVTPSECTEEGLRLFNIYSQEDLERYLNAEETIF